MSGIKVLSLPPDLDAEVIGREAEIKASWVSFGDAHGFRQNVS